MVFVVAQRGDVCATVFAESDVILEYADLRPVSNTQTCVTQRCTWTVGATAVFGTVVEDVVGDVRALKGDEH